MRRFTHTLIPVIVVSFLSCSVSANFAKGTYFSTSLGLNSTSSFDYLGSSTDQGSVCDPFINPSSDSRQTAGCPTEGTGWLTKFDRGSGIATSFFLGWHMDGPGRLQNLSVELEYSLRKSALNQTHSIRSRTGVARDKLSNEIYRAEEHISNISAHSAFANLLYNFGPQHRIQPFLGIGLGLTKTPIEGGRIWVRNHDWTQISTGSNLPNSEEIQRNLAGTTSTVHETIDDMLPSVQLLIGVNVQMTDTWSIGIRGHFVRMDSFEATGGLDVLRSHEVPDGYSSHREIDSLQLFGVGLNLTFLLTSR